MEPIKKLLQHHLEELESELQETGDVMGRATGAGATLRCAIRAGWFNGATKDDVANMDPRQVVALADKVNERYREATTIDPN